MHKSSSIHSILKFNLKFDFELIFSSIIEEQPRSFGKPRFLCRSLRSRNSALREPNCYEDLTTCRCAITPLWLVPTFPVAFSNLLALQSQIEGNYTKRLESWTLDIVWKDCWTIGFSVVRLIACNQIFIRCLLSSSGPSSQRNINDIRMLNINSNFMKLRGLKTDVLVSVITINCVYIIRSCRPRESFFVDSGLSK